MLAGGWRLRVRYLPDGGVSLSAVARLLEALPEAQRVEVLVAPDGEA
jgi:hypothetical protein